MRTPWVPLGEVLQMARTPIALRDDEEYRRIGIYSWGKGMLRREAVPASEMGSMKYFTFPNPSLIFSNIQAWEGAVALADDADDGFVCSSRFYPYVPRQGQSVNLRFLLEFFRSSDGLDIMRAASPGTQVRNKVLSRGALESSLIPLPPLPEQDRIASYLSRFQTVRSYRDRGSSAVLDKVVGQAAMTGEAVRLGDAMALRREWIAVESMSTYRQIGVRGFGRGMIRYPETDAAGLSKLRYFKVRPHALIVSNIKAWEGAVTMAEEMDEGRVASNRFLQYESESDRVTTAWVADYLRSPMGIAQLSAVSPGSADRNRTLSIAGIEALKIPIPPVAVQRTIRDVRARLENLEGVAKRRDRLAGALLPAARNEIFNAMR